MRCPPLAYQWWMRWSLWRMWRWWRSPHAASSHQTSRGGSSAATHTASRDWIWYRQKMLKKKERRKKIINKTYIFLLVIFFNQKIVNETKIQILTKQILTKKFTKEGKLFYSKKSNFVLRIIRIRTNVIRILNTAWPPPKCFFNSPPDPGAGC